MARRPKITWKSLVSSKESPSIKYRRERRSEPRLQVSKGKEVKTDVRCSNGKVWPALTMNVSTHGALLQFLGKQVPPLRVNEKISIKLHCQDDVVWIAGVVRHRYANRIGMYFQTAMSHNAKTIKHLLSRVSKVVEHSWIHQRAV